MNIPRFWARAEHDGVGGLGWSFQDGEEALKNARVRARENAIRLESRGWERGGAAYYSIRPLQEPIIREFANESGDISALLTRNVYGALVLNTAQMMFVDVDLPASNPGRPGVLAALFGKKRTEENSPNPEIPAIARAQQWAGEQAPWNWRVYRTKAGLRFLATHRLFDIDEPIVDQAFDALGADPLYRKLCRAQKCFRARLTPKPWRAGYHASRLRWPFVDARAHAAHDRWENDYLQACQRYATCRALPAIGSAAQEPALGDLVAFHDAVTRVNSELPLA